jgi:amidase
MILLALTTPRSSLLGSRLVPLLRRGFASLATLPPRLIRRFPESPLLSRHFSEVPGKMQRTSEPATATSSPDSESAAAAAAQGESSVQQRRFPVVEKSIAELRAALESGEATCVDIVQSYLHRIATFDSSGITLNAVVEINPSALSDAAESDRRRAAGQSRGPLEGIPFTAKDSYMVQGMTVASGSPAFAHLVASRDAFSIQRLRDAGCVFIGLTNMPPMANGGMQRGLYGRAESPYNGEFLTSAWASGSSNGSGTATAASFAAFGLGEETWSSGRAPASCNGLCAYTPSRGVISTRGNWPLVPTMDVVVPHTRTMADMLEILEVMVADDPDTRGDFWRAQPWVRLPRASEVRPASYRALAVAEAAVGAPESGAVGADGAAGVPAKKKMRDDSNSANKMKKSPLAGARIAVPVMFIGKDPAQGTGTGMGSSTGRRIEPRPSMLALWEAARADLEAAGAEVVETDFPVVTNYEGDRAGAPNVFTRGLVPKPFFDAEIWELSMWSWHEFLRANAQPGLDALALVEEEKIFPRHALDEVPDQFSEFDIDIRDYVRRARAHGIIDPFTEGASTAADAAAAAATATTATISSSSKSSSNGGGGGGGGGGEAQPIQRVIRMGIEGLEQTRRVDLDEWMHVHAFDAVAFPTLADVAPADADKNPASAEVAWRNGVWVATGNLAVRHLGIPTVTVPMGVAGDIGMPFGLTFAGEAYSDTRLLAIAAHFEQLRPTRRSAPPRTPELFD